MATTRYGTLSMQEGDDLSVISDNSIHIVSYTARPRAAPATVTVHVTRAKTQDVWLCVYILVLFFGCAVLGGGFLIWEHYKK